MGITQLAATDSLSRTTTGLKAHTMLRLQMTLVKGDSFDNEYLFVDVDGLRVFAEQASGNDGTQESVEP